MICDAVLAALVVPLAYELSPYPIETSAAPPGHASLGLMSGLHAGAIVLMSQVVGLQSPLLRPRLLSLVLASAVASWIALVMVCTIIFGVLYLQVGRYILLQLVCYAPVLLFIPRLLCWHFTEHAPRRVVLLGSMSELDELQTMIGQYSAPIQVVRRIGREELGIAGGGEAELEWKPCVPLARVVAETQADEIVHVLKVPEETAFSQIILDALSGGMAVTSYVSFIEQHFLRVPVRHISVDWFLEANPRSSHLISEAVKRLVDVTAAEAPIVGAVAM